MMDIRLPPRQRAGYVLISALMLLTVVAALGLTYSRHVVIERESSATSLSITRAQEAALATVDFARQAIQSGGSSAIVPSIEDLAAGSLSLHGGGNNGVIGQGDLASPLKASNWVEIEPCCGSTETPSKIVAPVIR